MKKRNLYLKHNRYNISYYKTLSNRSRMNFSSSLSHACAVIRHNPIVSAIIGSIRPDMILAISLSLAVRQITGLFGPLCSAFVLSTTGSSLTVQARDLIVLYVEGKISRIFLHYNFCIFKPIFLHQNFLFYSKNFFWQPKFSFFYTKHFLFLPQNFSFLHRFFTPIFSHQFFHNNIFGFFCTNFFTSKIWRFSKNFFGFLDQNFCLQMTVFTRKNCLQSSRVWKNV